MKKIKSEEILKNQKLKKWGMEIEQKNIPNVLKIEEEKDDAENS